MSTCQGKRKDNEPCNNRVKKGETHCWLHRTGKSSTSSNNLLNKYGKLIRVYKGSGDLYLSSTKKFACPFEVAQVSDGRLYALCDVISDDFDIIWDAEGIRLNGVLDDGRILAFEGLMVVSSLPNYLRKIGYTQRVVVYGKQATITNHTCPQSSPTFRFALANLTLLGTELYKIQHKDGGISGERRLGLSLDDHDVIIRRIDEYKDIISELKATGRTDVTSEAMIAGDTIEDKEKVIHIIDDLCLLFTLARGCRVTWLYYDIETPEGITFESYHRSAITSRFADFNLIATDPPRDTLDFINQTYSNLRSNEKPWELKKAINAYTDAKLEGDYLEFRGLKMVVTMEHLKSRYLIQHNRVHILPPRMFDVAVDSLVKIIRGVLSAAFPQAQTEKLDMMANHAKGFNWYPFRRTLSELCKDLGVQVNSTERGRFVDIRNELVHKAAFGTKNGTPWEQYNFIMTFIGRMLLAILGYDGYYYDWTKEPGWVGEDMEMRVKLDLKRENNPK